MLDSFQNIVVSSFPNILEVEFKYINRKYLKVILINITFVYLSLLSVVFLLFLTCFGRFGPLFVVGEPLCDLETPS